jgi:hypothetical protein
MKKFLLVIICCFTALTVFAQGKIYTEKLVVTVNGEDSEPQDANVSVEDNGNGTINFVLKNFFLSSGDDAIPVGNINVENVPVTKGNDGLDYIFFEGSTTIQPGDMEGVDMWVGPMFGEIPMKLQGKMNDEKLFVTIDIDMQEAMGRVIYVLLGSDFTEAGGVGNQQLTNTTFDATWVACYPWEAGKFVSSARGTQPEGWCISNVSQSALPIVGEEVVPGANGSGKAVKLKNVSASIGSNTAPGYITLGTAFATAETKLTSVRNADGGVFGGIAFTYHPDAVRLTYQHDISKGAENMTVIAYLWKGTWTQEDVPSNTAIGIFDWATATKLTMTDRIQNILGIQTLTGGEVTHSDDAALIAKVEYYNNEAVNDWTTQEFPLNYGEYAGKQVDVEKLNIVIASNGLFDDRSTIKAGNYVVVDDVELVYWHALSSLSYEGATLDFSEAATSYDLSDIVYDESKLSYTVKGQAATATKIYDEKTALLTIRVEGEDIASNASSFTEYTIQFKASEVEPKVISSKTYSEDFYLTLAGVTAEKQVADVVVETLDNGNVNFVLKNFALSVSGVVMPIGNIVVENLTLAEDNSFLFNGGIQLLEGDDPTYAGQWMGPSVTMMCGGSVPLDLSGKFIDENHVVVYISINLTEIIGYAVDVHLGYARAMMAVESEDKYGTFCAPFAVTVPDGVQAYTVNSATTAGVLTLTEVADNIPANTPVVLFAENGLTPVESFGVPEDGVPTVGLLTGVYEDAVVPAGGYVLQNLDGKVGFYHVAAGQQPTVKANNAYLIVPDSALEAYYFNEDEATGIASPFVENAEGAAIYNLAGEKVNNSQKGIYIINGRKVLVK